MMMMTVRNLSPDRLYLVALSGGADSVALALMMAERGLRIHALHCNFHLRGEESDRDEGFVRNLCTERGIPLEVKHFDTRRSAREQGASIEMEARRLRYEWFAQRARELGAYAVCVAHHRDDQAETLLMNLIRGTGLRGLAAMSPDRVIKGLRILRPLLGLSRQDITDFLRERGQAFVTDSTNLEREALRNRIRLDVMPLLKELNPNVAECLARTAENVRLELETGDADGEGHFHQWLAPLGFSRGQIVDIYAHHVQGTKVSGLVWHSPSHTLLLNRGEWVLSENVGDAGMPSLNTRLLPAGEIPSADALRCKDTAFIDADMLRGGLVMRRMRSGDRFRPFGMRSGSKLVSDFLTDRKVNLLEKMSQLVVVDTGTRAIVWVVGREIDDRYRVSHDSKNIMCLTLDGLQ